MKKLLLALVLIATVCVVTAASRKPFYADAGLYLTKGTVVGSGDGTVTNTFTTAYSSAPTVVFCALGAALPVTNQVCIVTTSNFVLTCRVPGMTNNWIAIGAP